MFLREIMKLYLILLIASSVFDCVENQEGGKTEFSQTMASFLSRFIEHLWKDCLTQKHLEEHLDAFKECIQQPWKDPEAKKSPRSDKLCEMFHSNKECAEEFVNNVPECAVKKSRNHYLLNQYTHLIAVITHDLCDEDNIEPLKALIEDPITECNIKLIGVDIDCKGKYIEDLFNGSSKQCWIWRKLELCVQDAMVNEREGGCDIEKFRKVAHLQAVFTITLKQYKCKINETLPNKEEAKIPSQPPVKDEEKITDQPTVKDEEKITDQPTVKDEEKITDQPTVKDAEKITDQPPAKDEEKKTDQPPAKDEEEKPDQPPPPEQQRGSKPSASTKSAPVSETLLQITILWVVAAKTLFSFDSN